MSKEFEKEAIERMDKMDKRMDKMDKKIGSIEEKIKSNTRNE